MHVVATAGHVDHGKSTLVLALTGMDPDRLAEEKARGLTIDLGFAWTTLPSGRTVSFVDVPGHIRFLKNMLAGVGAIDASLFVIAANEGWKPQSEEHLRILDLLALVPGGRRVRVRALQSCQQTRERVPPGSRVAVNLANVHRADVTRGDALVRPGQWEPATVFDASLTVLASLEHPVSRRGAYQAYIGSGEYPVKVRVLTGRDSVEPRDTGF